MTPPDRWLAFITPLILRFSFILLPFHADIFVATLSLFDILRHAIIFIACFSPQPLFS